MRLWHIDLIPYLPKSQLIAQWRELNSIFKKQDNHILINYVYDYPLIFLHFYTRCVMFEMEKRKIKIRSLENYNKYFNSIKDISFFVSNYQYPEHDDEYLLSNFFNLLEKFRRGQKDFTKEQFSRLYDFINKKIDLESIGIYKKIN